MPTLPDALPRQTLVRHYVANRLLGQTDAGDSVYMTRFRTVPKLPAINLYIDEAPVVRQDNQTQFVEASLKIECIVAQNNALDDALDRLCQQTLARLPQVARGVWQWIEYNGFKLFTGEAHSDQAVLIGQLECTVKWTQPIPLGDADFEFRLTDLVTLAGTLRPDGATETMGALADSLSP